MFWSDYMSYKVLGKLFFGDQKVYTETYKLRFDSDCTIKLNFLVSGHQAFFVQSQEVMSLAYDIMKLDKKVSKLSMLLPGAAKEQYSRKCLIDEIVLTNKIEGVHSSRKEITEALEILSSQSEKRGKHHRFIGLVNKYLKLMTEEAIPLYTCEDIRNIYDELFLEEVKAEDPKNVPDGQIFRKEISEVYSETGKVIHKGLYPEKEIIESMEKALEFLNDDSIDSLFTMCVFHYLIEYIHPFYDGNGRLGRFILSYCLSDILEPLLAYRISETIKENINEYYRAFTTCNDSRNLGDITPFLLMLLNMIYNSLVELNESLTRKMMSWNKYKALVSGFSESSNDDIMAMYSLLIQASLFSEEGISTSQIKTCSQKSYYSVKKILDQVNPDLLISEMKGKDKYYQIDLKKLDKMLLKDNLN